MWSIRLSSRRDLDWAPWIRSPVMIFQGGGACVFSAGYLCCAHLCGTSQDEGICAGAGGLR